MTRPWRWGCPECGEIEALGETVESIRRHGITFDSRGMPSFQDDLGEIHSTVLGYHCYSCATDFGRPRRYYGEMEIRWSAERGHWYCPVNGCRVTTAKPDQACLGHGDTPHIPTKMVFASPVECHRIYLDWGEFTMDLRRRSINFATLNQLEVNGKTMFTHENPASEVQIPQETHTHG